MEARFSYINKFGTPKGKLDQERELTGPHFTTPVFLGLFLYIVEDDHVPVHEAGPP